MMGRVRVARAQRSRAGERTEPAWYDGPAERIEGGLLADLYLRHSDGAARLAYLLTGDRALAEDLMQEAFVRLTGRLLHVRNRDAFDAYLRRTVVNLARSYFRRRTVEKRYVVRQAGAPAPATVGPDLGERDRMRRALLALPERQRAALVLHFYEDLPERQVADILRCRPGTVKSLVSRGMASLRAMLEES